MAAELSATVLEENDQTVLIAYRFQKAEVEFKSGGQKAVAEAGRIARGLSRYVFAQVTREGRVISVRFDPQEGILPQSFFRTLVAATQFVFPPAPTRERTIWEVEEDDPNGEYLARYEVLGSGQDCDTESGTATIRKSKLQYPKQAWEPAPERTGLPTQILPSGYLVGKFDCPAGHLISLHGSETQVVEIADKVVARTEVTLRLDFLYKGKRNAAELASLRQASAEREKVAAAIPLSWRVPEKATEEALQRKVLGTATSDELLAEVRREESAGKKPPGDWQLYRKLKALVYLQPAVSEKLAAILVEAPADSLTMSMLTGALGAVGHPEAQAALVSVIRKRSADPGALVLLVRSLASATAPTELAEETLRNLACRPSNPEIAYAAQLALGTMARSLLRISPERAAGIVDSLIRHFDPKPAPGQARQLLQALGNTGSPRALSAIRRFSGDSSPQVRLAAAGALRFIEGAESDSLLAKTLAKDPETVVRLEAAETLSYRPITPHTFAAQKQAFREEKEGTVRLVLLENLWWARQKFPEARELVRAAAADETSPEVRKKAAWLLASER